MLIGEIEAGKTTLINALFDKDETARKTQAIEYEGNGMDTPGEYFSHPRLYSALLSSAQDMDTLVYVHRADRDTCRLPPGLLDVYLNKRVIGVITKTDLPDARPDAAEAPAASTRHSRRHLPHLLARRCLDRRAQRVLLAPARQRPSRSVHNMKILISAETVRRPSPAARPFSLPATRCW